MVTPFHPTAPIMPSVIVPAPMSRSVIAAIISVLVSVLIAMPIARVRVSRNGHAQAGRRYRKCNGYLENIHSRLL